MMITLNNKMNVCQGAKNGEDTDDGGDDKIATTLAMDAMVVSSE